MKLSACLGAFVLVQVACKSNVSHPSEPTVVIRGPLHDAAIDAGLVLHSNIDSSTPRSEPEVGTHVIPSLDVPRPEDVGLLRDSDDDVTTANADLEAADGGSDRGVVSLNTDGGIADSPFATATPLPRAPFVHDGRLMVSWSRDEFAVLESGRVRHVRWHTFGGVDLLGEGPDGTLWMGNFFSFHRYAAGREGALNVEGYHSNRFVPVTGGVWISTSEGLVFHDGHQAHPPEMQEARGCAFDVDRIGQLWCVRTLQKIFVRSPSGIWRQEPPLAPPSGASFELSVDNVVALDTGLVCVHTGQLILCTDGSAVHTLDLPHAGFTDKIVAVAAAPGGWLFTLHQHGDVVASTLSGSVFGHGRIGSFGHDVVRNGFQVDQSGRSWLLGDENIESMEADGTLASTPFRIFTPNQLRFLFTVVGRGPVLPVVPPLPTGELRGTLLTHGVPIAGATVEVCPLPALTATPSPCSSNAKHFAGLTNADGTFQISGLPLRTWGVAVQSSASTGWSIVREGCCEAMTAARPFELGRIDLAQ